MVVLLQQKKLNCRERGGNSHSIKILKNPDSLDIIEKALNRCNAFDFYKYHMISHYQRKIPQKSFAFYFIFIFINICNEFMLSNSPLLFQLQ